MYSSAMIANHVTVGIEHSENSLSIAMNDALEYDESKNLTDIDKETIRSHNFRANILAIALAVGFLILMISVSIVILEKAGIIRKIIRFLRK